MEDEQKPVEDKAKKKDSKSEKENVKNTIELNPRLNEAKGKTVVLGWGRMNPITSGHEILVNKIKSVAKSNSATPLVYLTHSSDPRKNPLSYDDKIRFAKKAFGRVIQKSNSKTIIQAVQELDGKYDNLILVVGADRIQEFKTLLNKYNGKDYNFDSIEIVSAGDRADPDSEAAKDLSAANMSASVMRRLAAQGDKEDFMTGLPKGLKSSGEEVYNAVRRGMKIAEEMEAELMAEGLLDEAVLDFAQRRKRAITMRKYKSKIAMGRRRAMRRKATTEVLKRRARKAAIGVIRQKVAGSKNRKYADLSIGEKKLIDTKVQKRKAAIERIARKLLPKIRQKDMRKGKSVNEEFELFIEAAQDPDIKDREGTQPKKYFSGLAKSTKAKRDAHFKKGAEMDDNNPDAYKPAPGDADAKTKESQHTKKFKQMYGEETEAPRKKRFHQLMNGDGTVKHDMRFKRYKANKVETNTNFSEDADALKKQHDREKEKLAREHEREMDRAKTRELRQQIRTVQTEEIDIENDAELLKLVDEIYESVVLEESKTEEALKKKAEKSGISYGILKKVYDRGVAAWRTGHRPGTTPAQWGMARVNSFATKSKGTWGKADADLASKVRSEEVDLDSFFDLNEQFDLMNESIIDKALAAIHKHVMSGAALQDISFEVSRASGVDQTAQQLRKAYISKYGDPDKVKVDTKRVASLKKRYGFREEGGAGEWGTDKLAKRYKKDTPGENIKEDVGSVKHHLGVGSNFKHMLKHAVKHVDYDNDGDVDADDFKKTVPDEITGAEKKDLTKAAFKKYAHEKQHTRKGVAFEGVNEAFEDLMEAQCDLIGPDQIKAFEKFVDRMFEKFGIDFNFTKHFGERMSDERNTPCITMKELATFIKKIYANQGKSLKGVAGAEAVIKDIQTDLNIPVAVKYDSRNDEFDVVMKTIMRKKNFKTPNKVIKY
jgi:nicotinic acid mononucleotide adenylyltransferase